MCHDVDMENHYERERADGPYRTLAQASQAAFLSVDPPRTLWSVIELFGDHFDHTQSNGEIWGQLWVVDDSYVQNFVETMGAADHQVLDTFGYEAEQTA